MNVGHIESERMVCNCPSSVRELGPRWHDAHSSVNERHENQQAPLRAKLLSRKVHPGLTITARCATLLVFS
jgi:hypothetical protein